MSELDRTGDMDEAVASSDADTDVELDPKRELNFVLKRRRRDS